MSKQKTSQNALLDVEERELFRLFSRMFGFILLTFYASIVNKTNLRKNNEQNVHSQVCF